MKKIRRKVFKPKAIRTESRPSIFHRTKTVEFPRIGLSHTVAEHMRLTVQRRDKHADLRNWFECISISLIDKKKESVVESARYIAYELRRIIPEWDFRLVIQEDQSASDIQILSV